MLLRETTGIGASKTAIRPGLALSGESAYANQGGIFADNYQKIHIFTCTYSNTTAV